MKKIKMARGTTMTFEEGCNKYLDNCRQRNLREGTINHYRQSYLYFYKYFDPKMPIEDIDEQTYKDYVLHLKATLNNDTSNIIWIIRQAKNRSGLQKITFKNLNNEKSALPKYLREGSVQLIARYFKLNIVLG